MSPTITLDHLSRNGDAAVRVGDSATMLLYSDAHAGTVVYVSASGKTIKVQRDTAKRTDKNGQSEDQRYAYERNPGGPVTTYRFSSRYGWINRNATARRCLVGVRREWYDPTF